MKILHTSDWHIGATWEGVDRSEDLLDRAVPDVIEIALKNKADLLLVTGDIFERQTNDALEKAARTLKEPFRELLAANIDIALLPGNHDSYPLFRLLRSAIELVENQEKNKGKLHILNSAWVTPIKGIQIIHLPYLRSEQIERIINETLSDMPDSIEMVHQELGRRLDHIAQWLRGKINSQSACLFAYHGIVSGSTIGSDEQTYEFTYHQDYMLSPESLLFNDQVPNYNALGHIHKCQELSGPVPTWYAGSIDRLDRGERTYKPSVMIVEYSNNKRRVAVESLQLPRPTPFLDENIENEEQLKALCKELGPEGCELALGRVTLTCDLADVYILDQAVRDAFPRLRGIKGAVKRSRNMLEDFDNSVHSIDLKELVNPVYTIRTYISEKLSQERQEGLFDALAIVEDEINNDN